MATIAKIKQKDGTIILPTTNTYAVVLPDGSTQLSDKLDDIDSSILTNSSAIITNAGNISTHTGNTSNPHGVTSTQVGLGNVTNESKATMFTSPTFTGTPTLSGSGRMIADSASTGTDIYYIWSGTQAQYDAIVTKDGNTLYFIVG